MMIQLRAKLERLQEENLVLQRKNAKLKEKLIHCTEFFRQLITEFDTNNHKKDIWISQLAKENEYLKSIISENHFQPNLKVLKKAKTMDCIESDSDNENSNERIVSIAVKLLAIKYNFERRNNNRAKKQANQRAKDKASLYASMQDRSSSLESLTSDKIASKMNKWLESNSEENEIEEVDFEVEDLTPTPNNKENLKNSNTQKPIEDIKTHLSRSCDDIVANEEKDEVDEINMEVQRRLSSYSFV
eukprot:TRINITY_DN9634_c0_g5_i1.p2 TRINITY_DN9634_c0_g5~~TRINITY_DN9634_c0_g5_i1.p2  ORF type:complete len:245 (-),score=65.43 TRINITY_DN9634_c0_g5_i1:129-863(-)